MKKNEQKQQKPNTVLVVAIPGNDWVIKQKYSTLENKMPKPKDMGGES